MPRHSDTAITVLDEARARKFLELFGTATVYVVSPIPSHKWYRGAMHDLYYLDLDRIKPDQFLKLVAHVANTKGILRIDAEREIRRDGYPIVAAQTQIHTPMKLFNEDSAE